MNNYIDLSEELDNLHDKVNGVKDSDLFKKLNYLQKEIESLKEDLISDRYKSETDKLMESTDDTYRKNLSESVMSFIEDMDLSEISDEGDYIRCNVTENPMIISDKFSIKLKTDFIESEFIEKWKEGKVDDASFMFLIKYLPKDESISLYIKGKVIKLSNDNEDSEEYLTFFIDENELSETEFMKTLFKRSEYWDLQVLRKSDLQVVLVEKGEDESVETNVEFESIKFK